jgi:hypothetical protein
MIRKSVRAVIIVVALVLCWPAGAEAGLGETKPLVWNAIPCAQVSISDATLTETPMRAGGALRLHGELTPCRPASNKEWFALGIYSRWRAFGHPYEQAKVDYRTLYDPADVAAPPARTNFVIPARFVTALYDQVGICVVTDFDVRLACFRVDDPDADARGDLTFSRIPTDDPLVARRLHDRVPTGTSEPNPVCGTCW